MNPQTMREIISYVGRHRTVDGPFDYVVSGLPPGGDSSRESELAAAYRETGVTWWIAPGWYESAEECGRRIAKGPPRA